VWLCPGFTTKMLLWLILASLLNIPAFLPGYW
jgi:hypothetical protein